jgi:chorismate dehydratase
VDEVIRIGGVRYLNARPLVYGLDDRSDVRLRLETPAALAPLLKSGEVDVAMVPSIEYFRMAADQTERARRPQRSTGTGPQPDKLNEAEIRRGEPPVAHTASAQAPRRGRYVALPVAAIGSRGEVGSVRLFGYREMEQVRRVLLDPASRTSNALARLLLARRHRVEPHFVLPQEIGPNPSRPPDAEVVVGDPGLVASRCGALWDLDLGHEWHEWTHLPFVYAFWVARADGPLDRITALLAEARDAGLAAREALATQAAPALGLEVRVARRYLAKQVRYAFGPKEQDGLRAFYRMAAEDGLAPEGMKLRLFRRPDVTP